MKAYNKSGSILVIRSGYVELSKLSVEVITHKLRCFPYHEIQTYLLIDLQHEYQMELEPEKLELMQKKLLCAGSAAFVRSN